MRLGLDFGAQIGGDRLAVNYFRAHRSAFVNRSSIALSVCASPTSRLTRADAAAATSLASEYVWQDVQRDHVANEHDDQKQDHRRDIDPAEIRQEIADRSQHRLGDAVEKISDHSHDGVARVHHVESHQPGKDRHCDHDPDIELESQIDDEKKGAHGWGSLLRLAET